MPRSPLRRAALRAIDTYRSDVSSRLHTHCSLEPSCSAYARDVFARRMFVTAMTLTWIRLVRCAHRARLERLHRPRKRLALLGAMGAATAVVTFPYLVDPAGAAQITGPCTATLAGVSANDARSPDTAVYVDYNNRVEVVGTMPSGPVTYHVGLEFADFTWTVKDGTSDGASWSNTIDVADYATYGVGLYKVSASSTNAAGEQCTAVGYVEVGGKSPLTTVAGLAGVGAVGVGALALGAATARAAVSADMDVAPTQAGFEGPEEKPEPWKPIDFCMIGLFSALFLTATALTRKAFREEER